MIKDSASRKADIESHPNDTPTILDYGARSLLGHTKQESLKSLSDAHHQDSHNSYSKGRSTAYLGGQAISIAPSDGRILPNVVDVQVGGRHSANSNHSKTIQTGSVRSFSFANIGAKSKASRQEPETAKVRSFTTLLRRGSSLAASTVNQEIKPAETADK